MRNKFYYTGGILFFFAAIAILILSVSAPKKVLNNINTASYAEETVKLAQINEIYDWNFIESKVKADRIACYVPRYEQNYLNDEIFYAELFGMNGEYTDEGDFHVYSRLNDEQSEKLSFHKYMNYIHFETVSIHSTSNIDIENNEKISPLSAIDAAKAFLKARALTIDYSEARVSVENNGFSIIFLKKMDYLKNYAFPVVVKTDQNGNVIYLDYYDLQYDKLSASSIKSMKEASLDLPLDFPDDTKIDLKNCELVYFYENSIVQPGYLFQGEIAGGGGFKCFVKASKFD